MKAKPVLRPERLRRPPRPFSWIDPRLVRDRHIMRCGSEALALYLLLVTVSDAQGLSYYSDAKAAELVSLSPAQLKRARAELIAAGLVAWRAPFYQVLSLDPERAAGAGAADARSGQTLSLADILRAALEGGQEGGERP